MGSTYLQLTNDLLESLNEAPLTSSTFSTARSIHATARQAVKFTVQELNKNPFEWPFNIADGSQLLVVGQEEYDWPADYKIADWKSFYIEKDDSLGISTRRLDMIDRDEWLHSLRDRDYDASTDGLNTPMFVFQSHGNKFGITPSPKLAYTVKYKYYIEPAVLSAYDDECNIPSSWDYVILRGGLYWMKKFKDDHDAARDLKKDYDEAVRHMRTLLVNVHYDHMRDTRVPERRRRGVYEEV